MSNLLGSRGPRKMKVFIPDVLEDDDMAIEKWYPNDHEKEGMLVSFK